MGKILIVAEKPAAGKDIAKVVIHCNEVPGYSFRIEECVRRGNNSGWLITGLEKLN